jgi:hypothetical protein
VGAFLPVTGNMIFTRLTEILIDILIYKTLFPILTTIIQFTFIQHTHFICYSHIVYIGDSLGHMICLLIYFWLAAMLLNILKCISSNLFILLPLTLLFFFFRFAQYFVLLKIPYFRFVSPKDRHFRITNHIFVVKK